MVFGGMLSFCSGRSGNRGGAALGSFVPAGRHRGGALDVGSWSPPRCTSVPCTDRSGGVRPWRGNAVGPATDSRRVSTYNSLRIAISPGRLRKHSSARRAAFADEAVPHKVATPLQMRMPKVCPANASSSRRIARARRPSSKSALSPTAACPKLGSQAKRSPKTGTRRRQSASGASAAASIMPCRQPLRTVAGDSIRPVVG